jgi:hypothetical protein
MFRYSICDPLKPEPVEMGTIEKDEIIDILNNFPWLELLKSMVGASEDDIYFSPSIEFENQTNRHGIAISMVDESEYYIFYKRPKQVSKFFGLTKYIDDNYLSDRMNQSLEDGKQALIALINDDLDTLERKWG